tara:strand:- start:978 stop:1229 length:252 start_codon:yes stop_codon:yes gene_type:complete
MGIKCSKPPRYAPPKDSTSDWQQEGSRDRLRKLTKLYDAAVDAGDFRLRVEYGSEMFVICKRLGYAGTCIYSDIRVFAEEASI